MVIAYQSTSGIVVGYYPRMLHVEDATQGCNQKLYTILHSKHVQHPGSNLYMYQTIDSIHNAIKRDTNDKPAIFSYTWI